MLPPSIAFGVTATLMGVAIAAAKKRIAKSPQDDLKANLAWANAAVRHARKAMKIGAANKDHSKKKEAGTCLAVVRSNDEKQRKDAKTQLESILVRADEAEQAGCGNCGEQSAIAFAYLSRKGVRPIDWARVANGDHAFVIIGRKKNSDIADYKTWGAVAVVADPWGNGAFEAKDMVAKGVYAPQNHKMFYGLIFRQD
jgi:hypothetical protein